MTVKAVIMHSHGSPGRVAIMTITKGDAPQAAIATDALLKLGVLTEAHIRLYFPPEKIGHVLNALAALGIEHEIRHPEGS